MKLTRKFMAAGALSLAVITGTSSAAMAAPASTGFDDVNQIVKSGGSDTTYTVQVALADLYNASPGCTTLNTAGAATLSQCLTTGQSATYVGTNWDHDVITNIYPTGSGAGVRAVLDGVWDTARSSSGPKNAQNPSQASLGFYGFGKDGLALITLEGRAAFNISTASVKNIYNCTYTTWGQVPEFGNSSDTTPILPYGMNTSSGTKSTFDSYLGFDTNSGTCVKKLASGSYPFENDVKPVIADAGANAANVIWFGSFAEFKTYSYKRGSAQYMSIDGASLSLGTISNNSWPLRRFVYQVAKQADVLPTNGTAGPFAGFTGGTSGVSGAVRQYIDFLCKPTAQFPSTAINPYNGNGYYAEVTATLSNNGFQRVPVSERSGGMACRLDVATS